MSWIVPSIILTLQFLQTKAESEEMKKKLQEIIDKLAVVAPEITIPPAVVPPPTLVISEPKRNNRYHIFEIDLSVAHTDEPLGIQDLVKAQNVKFCTYMIITAVPSAFSYRVNDKAASVNDAAVGDEWIEFEVEEVYITNSALAGTGKIHVEFRVG